MMTVPMRTRLILSICGFATLFGAAATPALAQQRPGFGGAQAAPAQQAQPQLRPSGPLEVDITQGQLNPIPIAVTDFVGDDPKTAADVSAIVAADLERSGLFRPLDKAGFLEVIRDPNAAPNFTNWRPSGAQALVVGRAGRGANGALTAEVRLYDVPSGKQLFGQRFGPIDGRDWRRLGHVIADQVYERLRGEKGYFDTQIVYVDETGPKDKRIKRLAIMDQDGANPRTLSQGRELVLTPRFSPTTQEIVFMQYADAGKTPRVYLMNLDSGQRQLLGNFNSTTFAPRFSPDGQRIVMSIDESGTTALIEMDLRSKQTRRLTQSGAIDTGPSYNPDGRQIVFESDRQNGQQLWLMNSDGTGQRRISTGGGRYSTPVWSPRGDLIAFTKQDGGTFKIGVMRPDGTGERILTDGYHNEGPTWSPNGRVLMFFREGQGANGGPRLHSVDLTGYNERPVPTPSFGSDPAWSPLRN